MGIWREKKIVIIDYHLGNLFSVKHACQRLGLQVEISSDVATIMEADALILPGVGAFGDAINTLNQLGLINPILESIEAGKPFFGICLGMQLLFEESEEFGSYHGLGVFKGTIKKFPENYNGTPLRVPQIAWNKIIRPSDENGSFWQNTPLEDLKEEDYMYFVHSFYVDPANKKNILTETVYNGLRYCSGVQNKNVFAVQFHPEKSGEKGIAIYENWAKQYLSK